VRKGPLLLPHFSTCRELYVCCPKFPVEEDLIKSVLNSGDVNQYSKKSRLWSLSKFVREWTCLEVGGLLLPPLMELYQWLHTDIAHLLTHEQASSLTIGQLIELAERKFDSQFKQHIRNIYNTVKQEYNHYVKLRGATANNLKDDTPLLDLLTGTHCWDHACKLTFYTLSRHPSRLANGTFQDCCHPMG
jgi:hypothetical protein